MKMDSCVGQRLRLLRQRGGMTLRELAERAGVTPAMVSYVEHGKSSPSLVTLEKLLGALGTNLASFFGAEQPSSAGPVFARETMRLISDGVRSYTLVFPHQAGLGLEMMDELLRPSRIRPDFEVRSRDVAGYVVSGELMLEMDGQSPQKLRPGDAFYVRAGVAHRGFASGREPVRLVSVSASPAGKSKRSKKAKH